MHAWGDGRIFLELQKSLGSLRSLRLMSKRPGLWLWKPNHFCGVWCETFLETYAPSHWALNWLWLTSHLWYMHAKRVYISPLFPCLFGDGKISPIIIVVYIPIIKDSLLKVGWVYPQYTELIDLGTKKTFVEASLAFGLVFIIVWVGSGILVTILRYWGRGASGVSWIDLAVEFWPWESL